MNRDPQRKPAAAAKILLACVALILLPNPGWAPPVTRPGAALPQSAFAVGERLVYHVEWNPPLWLFLLPTMEAGQATLSIEGETQYQDRRALRIVFTARSSGMLARLIHMNVDDYYEFITDAETFCTYSVVKREREGKRMRDIDITYFAHEGKLHLREVDVAAAGKILRDRDYEGIPPCVKDLFSALYALRRNRLEIGAKERIMVGDNQTVKEVEISVEKKERVITPIGAYSCSLINTVAVMGGLFKNGGQFRIWLSDDNRQIPVKFEAKVSLGKVTGSLKETKFPN